MAQLPPDGEWLVQLVGTEVIVFQRYTEVEVVRYDVRSANAAATAQGIIHISELLDDEQKSFAHFWCGYFHGYGGAEAQ
jgi:hypothetical protein